MPFVLDASVTLAWAFEDESTPYTDAVQQALRHDQARVPAIWWLEVCNALMLAERHKRIQIADMMHFIELVQGLPIEVDRVSSHRVADRTIDLARNHSLTVYDASYLELAIHESLPLTTLDRRLRAAAEQTGVPLFSG